jgi:exodeoxyribonuclease-3
MRITTWNVNGLRAAVRKGFGDCLAQIAPDVLLLQEVRCTPKQLDPRWAGPVGWHVHWHPAERKGYGGTSVWSRRPMQLVGRGLGDGDGDADGRVITVQVRDVTLICVYLPSGSASPERQAYKEAWMDRFFPWVRRMASRRGPVVLGGDLNIAHTQRDIYYAKSNEKSSGFLPQEREWFGRLLETGWSDFVRLQFGEVDGPYSWWSNRGRARELDRGWRIDYLLGNRAAAQRWRKAWIYREGGLTVSDHAPVTIDLAAD